MQDVSSALIAAETRIGEILLSIPKSSGGDRKSEDFKNRDTSNFEKTKAETISEMGYSKDQASDYQRMAQNPAIVNLVLERAEREGRVVSHTEVMRQIKEKDAEIARLHDDNKILARRSAQEPEEQKTKQLRLSVYPVKR